MLVYFAAPLFSVGERQFNEHLTQKIEALGYRVFLPQRDGAERGAPPYDQMTGEEWSRAVFQLDTEQLLAANVLLFMLDGRVPDEGACVELGIAWGQKTLQQARKLLIGLHTDRRGAFPGTKLNAMIQGALEFVAPDEQTLLDALKHYKEGGSLLGGEG
jgi:nucleoside 2-deoxyribosyltransferase